MPTINANPCRGCGRNLFTASVANLDVRVETDPLDGDQAVQALIAGRGLWRVTYPGGLSPANAATLAALRTEPGERPYVVQEHVCTPVSWPYSPPPVPEANQAPKGRQRPLVAVSTLSSVPRAERSSANGAANPVSDGRTGPSRHSGPRCSGCGNPCADGTYASVALGDIVLWAQHVTDCPGA